MSESIQNMSLSDGPVLFNMMRSSCLQMTQSYSSLFQLCTLWVDKALVGQSYLMEFISPVLEKSKIKNWASIYYLLNSREGQNYEFYCHLPFVVDAPFVSENSNLTTLGLLVYIDSYSLHQPCSLWAAVLVVGSLLVLPFFPSEHE